MVLTDRQLDFAKGESHFHSKTRIYDCDLACALRLHQLRMVGYQLVCVSAHLPAEVYEMAKYYKKRTDDVAINMVNRV
eukprot:1323661-Amorphochlora_amoeboformis.AAC.1